MPSIIGQMKAFIKGGTTVQTEDADLMVVPVGTVKEVPVNYNEVLYGSLVVAGSYVVGGTLIVDAIPT